MAGDNEDRQRQVVPRWRTFSRTALSGELRSERPALLFRPDAIFVADQLRDWERHKTLSFAADLLSATIVEGHADLARRAALSIISSDTGNSVLLALSHDIVNHGLAKTIALPDSADIHAYRILRDLKHRLTQFPRDAVSWVDAARGYITLGQIEAAKRCMRIALAIAPTNRFVLRSAARFYLLIGDPERAIYVLRNKDMVLSDPWLLSAEIAIAEAAHRTSKFVSRGRLIIDSQDHDPLSVSELASAIATIEHKTGSRKSLSRLWQRALERPTENAIAQAAWVARTFDDVTINEGVLAQSAEASAWTASELGHWETAVDQVQAWQADQPFSSRPAILGSFICSRAVEDFDKAAQFAERALPANPYDFGLLNNLAFALAMNNHALQAQKHLDSVDVRRLSDSDRMVFLATSGLVQYRLHNDSEGSRRYSESVHLAQQLRDERQIIAEIYFAMERIRSRHPNAGPLKQQVLSDAMKTRFKKIMSKPENRILLARLRSAEVSS